VRRKLRAGWRLISLAKGLTRKQCSKKPDRRVWLKETPSGRRRAVVYVCVCLYVAPLRDGGGKDAVRPSLKRRKMLHEGTKVGAY